MPVDPSISLQAQTPNALNTLGNVMNTANSMQNFQRGNIALQNEQATQQATQDQIKAQSTSAQQQAQQETLKTNAMHLANGVSQILPLLGTNATSEKIRNTIINTMTNMKSPQEAINQAVQNVPSQEELDATPGASDAAIVKIALSGVGGIAQINKMVPDLTPISTGGKVQFASTGNPLATGKAQEPLTNTPAPNTEVIDPATGQKMLIGNGDQRGPATSMAPLDANALAGWGQHWNNTVASAAQAPQNITLLQNAKSNVAGAITGSGQQYENMLNSVGSALGFKPSESAKNNLDLFNKDLSQYVASKGEAGTNLAKEITAAGTPGQHMNTAAAYKGLDDLIAQERMKLAQQQFFSQAGNNPQAYGNKFLEWNKINDYRAMEWNDMSAKDKTDVVNQLKKNPAAAANFRNALVTFKNMGYVQ